jgi:DNA-binding IclR family transcriptional regulator
MVVRENTRCAAEAARDNGASLVDAGGIETPRLVGPRTHNSIDEDPNSTFWNNILPSGILSRHDRELRAAIFRLSELFSVKGCSSVSRHRDNPLFARLTDLDRGDRRSLAEDDGKQFVTALARGLDVLRAFSQGGGLLGNQDIAQLTRLPKATVSRLTYTLSRLGFLDYDIRLAKYRPGIAGLALGHNALRALPVRRVAQPLMQEMSLRTKCTVSLLARDRLEVVIVEQCLGDGDFAFPHELGARVPITGTGLSRSLLVGLPKPERHYVLEHLERTQPDGWPDLQMRLYAALAEYQRLGFTVSDGDSGNHSVTVGAPCMAADGTRVVAFSCAAPAFRLSRERMIAEVGPALVAMVERVRRALEMGG